MHSELKQGESFLYNMEDEPFKKEFSNLKTLRKGKQAYDIYGRKLKRLVPVFIHNSEKEALNKCWAEILKNS